MDCVICGMPQLIGERAPHTDEEGYAARCPEAASFQPSDWDRDVHLRELPSAA